MPADRVKTPRASDFKICAGQGAEAGADYVRCAASAPTPAARIDPVRALRHDQRRFGADNKMRLCSSSDKEQNLSTRLRHH
jgi:hypothetical protein